MFIHQGTTPHKTKLIYASNDLDAWLAAFFYGAFFEHEGLVPVATLPVPLTGKTPAPHIRAINTISIGAHMTSSTVHAKFGKIDAGQDSQFFAFENKPTFERLISVSDMEANNAMPELGRRYIYSRTTPLAGPTSLFSLVLSEIADHFGFTDGNESKRWIQFNQFFEFESIRNAVLSPAVAKKVYDTFPNLQPSDFVEMSQMLRDPFTFFNKRRKTTLERELERLSIVATRERNAAFSATVNDTVVSVYNSDLIDCPFVKDLVLAFTENNPPEPVFLIKFAQYETQAATGVESRTMLRVRVLTPPNDHTFDALGVFDDCASVVGNGSDAEYLLPPSMINVLLERR
jgi:hypothetical protein